MTGELGGRNLHRQGRRISIIVAGSLILSWLLVARATWRVEPSIDRWTVADWLINYAGGSVRRGLVGEIVGRLTAEATDAAYVIISIQLVLLAGLYALVFQLFRRSSLSPTWLMLVLSPAFLLFPLASLQGGLRKELLALVAVALIASILSNGLHWSWLLGTVILFALAAFSHETAALSLPVIAYLLWWGKRNSLTPFGPTLFLTIAFLSIGTASLIFSALNSGDSQRAQVICEFWMDRGAHSEACEGAFASLGSTASDAIGEVIGRFPEYYAYPPLAIIALVPIAMLRPPRAFWFLVSATYLSLFPLFLTGIDYGRWIYFATALLSISALVVLRGKHAKEFRAPWYIALFYVLAWSLPYTGPVLQEPVYGGILSVGQEILVRLRS